ncbi:MAG: Ig-like domain-containing protein [Alkalispirochaeta sp.]
MKEERPRRGPLWTSPHTPFPFHLLVILLLCGVASVPSWALGTTEESDYTEVDGGETWTHEIDVGELEEGTHNVLVRATDNAGNQSLSSPTDIVVDSASDIPFVSISTPERAQVVGRQLMVLGTADDDDEVSRVEVQLNDTAPRTADGTDYWSMAFDLATVEDGTHVIRATAVDDGGTESEVAVRPFVLDTSGPAITVQEPAQSSTVGGRVSLAGTVADANGLVGIEIRVEQGSTEGGTADDERAVLFADENTIRRRRPEDDFSFRVDTGDMPDGPIVVWLSAEDVYGNTTDQPHLLFVDNQPPSLRIDQLDDTGEFPPDTIFPGDFVLTGRVGDTSGIDEFSYQIRGEEPQSIELAPGDPFWALPLAPEDAGDNVRIDFAVRDNAGNVTTQRVDVPLDQDADLPVVDLLPTQSPLFIAGSAEDDDGIAAVEYRHADDDEWQRIDTFGSFTIRLPERDGIVPAGQTEVLVRAVDRNGMTGPTVEVVRLVPPSEPRLSLPTIEIAVDEETVTHDLHHGRVLIGDQSATIRGLVDLGSRPGEIRQIRYRIDGGEWSSQRVSPSDTEEGLLQYSFSLNRREEAGIHTIEIEVDSATANGIETEPTVVDRFSTWYYRLDQVPEEPDPEETYLTEIPDPEELRVSDARLEAPLAEGGVLRFRNDRPLIAVVPGVELISAELRPEVPELAVAVVDGAVEVAPRSGFDPREGTLVATGADGTEWTSDPISLAFDEEAPSATITAPQANQIMQSLDEIVVSAADNTAVESVSVMINDGARQELQRGEDGLYRLMVGGDLGQGPISMEVEAIDALGNRTTDVVTAVLDSTGPVVELISPRSDDPVNGEITLAFALNDASPLTDVSWQPAGEESTVPVEPADVVKVPIRLQERHPDTPLPVITVTDGAGNRSELSVALNVDTESDQPQVAVQLPVDGSIQRKDFTVSGTVFDDDGPADVWYRIGDGDPVSIGSSSNFTIPIRVADLGDNEHTISVFARDRGGVQSEVVERQVEVSLEPPTGSVTAPAIERRNRGTVSLEGTAADANGIDQVEISLDNGVSFVAAGPHPDGEIGWDEWTFRLDTTVLRDGLHAVQYRITDRLGTVSLFFHLITIDNTPPELTLIAPEEREILGNEVLISGRVLDSGGLQEVSYRLAPVDTDSQEDPEWRTLELLPGGVVRAAVPAPVSGGDWNLALRARDEAGNLQEVSRNVRTTSRLTDVPIMRVLSPLDGEGRVGRTVVSGIVPSFGGYERVLVTVNDEQAQELRPDASGLFWMQLTRDDFSIGTHEIEIRAVSSIDAPDLVQRRTVEQQEFGPWVRLESHRSGQLVGMRPVISGLAGYSFPTVDGFEPGSREYRQAVAPYAIDTVEVSMDNGRSFDAARGRESWEYRIETGELDDGPLPVIIRTTAADGKTSVRRAVFRLDTRAPQVTIDQPRDGGRFNDSIFASGTADDENGLDRVELILRTGSKNRYATPEFIQGLYVDMHVMGATQWEVGAGLTFFDNNVKLQGQIGRAPEGRFSGTVFGGKLLANVASLPLSYVLGPDWEFLSGALAVGANFSYFSMEDDPRTDTGLVLGGIVGQLEFPIINREARMFNAFSFYTEIQFWFISSDIQGGTETKISFGLRTQLL